MKKINKLLIILLVTIMAMLSVTFVACDKPDKDEFTNNQNNIDTEQPEEDEQPVVNKKTWTQERNEVFEAEGKTKWYDYYDKEYSFGKLSYATSLEDPGCISYTWEDFKGYDTYFNEETTIKIIDEIEKEIYSQYGLTDMDKSDREALISFYDISDYTCFGAVLEEKKKEYDYLHEKQNKDYELSFEDACKERIVYLDRYEDDRIVMNKGMFWFLSNHYSESEHILRWYLLDDRDIPGWIEYQYADKYETVRIHTAIKDKKTGQEFIFIVYVDILMDYYTAVRESEAYAEDKESVIVAEQQKFAEILQPYLDEVVNGYLLEEFGVQL